MKNEMISQLTDLLSEASRLCQDSGYQEQSNWLRDRIQRIEVASLEELSSLLDEIQSILAGMGSFSDLPLRSNTQSGVTDKEIRCRQWELVEQIGQAIDKLTEQGASK